MSNISLSVSGAGVRINADDLRPMQFLGPLLKGKYFCDLLFSIRA